MKNVTFMGLCIVLCGALVGCGGDDDDSSTGNAIADCKSGIALFCEKTFACSTAEVLAANSATIGSKESECTSKLATNCTEDAVRCDPGTSYSSAMAEECIDQYEKLSCGDFTSGNTPAACENTCQ